MKLEYAYNTKLTKPLKDVRFNVKYVTSKTYCFQYIPHATLSFETANVTACQSKPGGTWDEEARRLTWKVGEVSSSTPQTGLGNLYARFPSKSTVRPRGMCL